MQTTRPATDIARRRSCSTRMTVASARAPSACRAIGRRCRRRAGRGPATPRRAGAAAGWTSAPGRSPSPAARRRTGVEALASGQRSQHREGVEDRVHGPLAGAPLARGGAQVLLDGQVREEPAALRNEGDAELHAAMGREVRDVRAVEPNATGRMVDGHRRSPAGAWSSRRRWPRRAPASIPGPRSATRCGRR